MCGIFHFTSALPPPPPPPAPVACCDFYRAINATCAAAAALRRRLRFVLALPASLSRLYAFIYIQRLTCSRVCVCGVCIYSRLWYPSLYSYHKSINVFIKGYRRVHMHVCLLMLINWLLRRYGGERRRQQVPLGFPPRSSVKLCGDVYASACAHLMRPRDMLMVVQCDVCCTSGLGCVKEEWDGFLSSRGAVLRCRVTCFRTNMYVGFFIRCYAVQCCACTGYGKDVDARHFVYVRRSQNIFWLGKYIDVDQQNSSGILVWV